jgi:hypothetical protein
MKYALMENRNGLVVDAEVTQASCAAEREVALRMVKRSVRRDSTLGADKTYDIKDFVQSLREQEVTPHVAAKRVGSAINGRTTRHAGSAVSLKKRKRVEEIFGWSKTIGGLRKTHFIGLAKVSSQTIFNLCLLQFDADGDAAGLAFVICIGRSPSTGRQKAPQTPKRGEKQPEIRLSGTTRA